MREPSYLELSRSGELARRAEQAWAVLESCRLCPHECGANRLAGERGVCWMGDTAYVASANLHAWEEPPISGSRGSGTIFFSGCTGHCLFCQNYPISQLLFGNPMSLEQLGDAMVRLQHRGAHNINFVTPTHFLPHIVGALPHAIRRGFRLPLLMNTSGYERVETLQLLEGVIDIYLPDAKYADDDVAVRLSGFPRYVAHNRAALREMFRQVGSELDLDQEGLAHRGMVVRHLVLPDSLAGTRSVLRWLADNLSRDLHVSLMAQYFPAHRAVGDAKLGRKITTAEYDQAIQALEDAGLENGWVQDMDDACGTNLAADEAGDGDDNLEHAC